MDMETVNQRKNKRKRLKVIIISSLILFVITAGVLLLIFRVVPTIKFNTACELLEQKQYMQAYEIFSQFDDSDSCYKRAECYAHHIYESAIKSGEYSKAFQMLNNEPYSLGEIDGYNSRIVDKLTSIKLNINEYEIYYNSICQVIHQNTSFEYWDDTGEYSQNSRLMYYLLSSLPLEYKDVSSLIMLFSDLKSGEIYPLADYMRENRDFLFTLWEYGFVRDFSTNDYNIKEYLSGVWSTDNSDNIPFGDPFTLKFLRDDGNITFESTGLSVPNVVHRYYDIVDCTLIYTNGDNALCNVFKFTIDETNPNKITVYCYEDDKSIVFYRVM